MVRIPVVACFCILCCLRGTWQEGCGKKKWPWMQASALFTSSRLGLAGVTQGAEAVGTLLQALFECFFVQRGHSLASAAPLKQRTDHKW
jgi:hypothetical protein